MVMMANDVSELENNGRKLLTLTTQDFNINELKFIKVDEERASNDELIISEGAQLVNIYFPFDIKELIYNFETLWKFNKDDPYHRPFCLTFDRTERSLYICEVKECSEIKRFENFGYRGRHRFAQCNKLKENYAENLRHPSRFWHYDVESEYDYDDDDLYEYDRCPCFVTCFRSKYDRLKRAKANNTIKRCTGENPSKIAPKSLEKILNKLGFFHPIELNINSNDKGEGYDIHLAKDYKTYTAQPGYGFSVVERMDEDFELIWSTAYPDKSVTYISIYETKEESLATMLLKDSTLIYFYKPRQYLKTKSGMEKIVENYTRWFGVTRETFDLKRLKGVKSDDKELSYDEFEVFAVKCYTVVFLGCNIRAILYDDEFLWQLEENPKYGNSVFLIYNPIYGTSAVYHHYIKLDSYKSIKFRSPTQLFEENKGNMQYLRKNMIRKYLLKHFNEYNNRRCGLCNHVLS